MGPKRLPLVVALALSIGLISVTADARFGKTGSGSGSGGGSGGGGHSASSPGSSGGGGASYTPRYQTYYPRYYPGPRYFYGSPYWYSPYWFGWGFGYYPYFYAEPPPPSISYVRPYQSEPEQPLRVSVGVDGQTVRRGYALGATLAVEGRRVGFIGQITGITVGTDDGTRGKDRIGLLNAHLSYAILSGQQGRLRVEGGVDTAFAPSVTLIGPGLGISGFTTIVGPFGIEGALRFTPTPYTQVDVQAGVTVALGPVGLRGGWRRIFLNDNGNAEADGTAHRDVFNGPYVGVSATF